MERQRSKSPEFNFYGVMDALVDKEHRMVIPSIFISDQQTEGFSLSIFYYSGGDGSVIFLIPKESLDQNSLDNLPKTLQLIDTGSLDSSHRYQLNVVVYDLLNSPKGIRLYGRGLYIIIQNNERFPKRAIPDAILPPEILRMLLKDKKSRDAHAFRQPHESEICKIVREEISRIFKKVELELKR